MNGYARQEQAPEPAGASTAVAEATLPAPTSERLRELYRLEPDWDSYGALRVSERAIATAGAFISRVCARLGDQAAPHEIMPIADGGVSLEWRYPGVEIGLNACPEGGWTSLIVQTGEGGRRASEKYDLTDEAALELVFETIGPTLSR